jgi:hypothetical protein
VSDGGRNPLFYGPFGAVLPSRIAWLAHSAAPPIGALNWRRARGARCVGPCRSSARTRTRRFPQAAAINARVGRKTGEHWRQLTSEVVETQSARRSQTRKPIKPGLYRFLLRALKPFLYDSSTHYSTPVYPGALRILLDVPA